MNTWRDFTLKKKFYSDDMNFLSYIYGLLDEFINYGKDWNHRMVD